MPAAVTLHADSPTGLLSFCDFGQFRSANFVPQ
ncbi:MAG: hypothetical protein ACI814_005176, partial [Mariniblastus sp.]